MDIDTDTSLLFEACLDPTDRPDLYTLIMQSGRPTEAPRFGVTITGTLEKCADGMMEIWNEHQSLLALIEGSMRTNLRCHNDIADRPDVQLFFRNLANRLSEYAGQPVFGEELVGRAH